MSAPARRTLSEGKSMRFNALGLDMHPYDDGGIFAKDAGELVLQSEHHQTMKYPDSSAFAPPSIAP